MRTCCRALKVIAFAFLLTFSMYLLTGCGSREAGEDLSGEYRLYSMLSGDDSYSHEDIVSYGLDNMALILYPDGTASLGFSGEEENFYWKEHILYSGEEELVFTSEDETITIVQGTETMVFVRSGNAPKKADITYPATATDGQS